MGPAPPSRDTSPREPVSGIASIFFSSVVSEEKPVLPDPVAGTRIGAPLDDKSGRYELTAWIADGRQAIVWSAVDRKLSNDTHTLDVAIKLFPKPTHSGGHDQAIAEGRFARLAQDPNVVTVLDTGVTAEGWPFLVLQRVTAIDLTTWKNARGKRIAERTIASIGRDVARGLLAIHDAKLVHCDVSPNNILIDRRTRAIVADFGCARGTEVPAAAGASGGTPAFMSPEQWRGAEPDSRSDVAALAGVLYWLLTGDAPYGDYAALVEAAHASPSEADLHRRRALATARVDPELAALVRSALAPIPSARPSAESLEEKLDQWLNRARRIRAIWILLAAVVAITAGGTATWFLLPPSTTINIQAADTEFKTLASALGVAPTDPHLAALAARGRAPGSIPPTAQAQREVVTWLAGRRPAVARASPLERWVVASLAASVALAHQDLASADAWLPVAEDALAAPECAALVASDTRWVHRLRGLVAAARLLRVSQSPSDTRPVVAPVERLRLDDWLDGGEKAWHGLDGGETATSQMLDLARTQLLLPRHIESAAR